jgi:hypothetical protein
VVAGLRAAARLATQLGHDASADRWLAFADRIWHDGIMRVIATSRPESPGLIDPESGRFLLVRRLSKHKGLWTDLPESLIEHGLSLDITMLGLCVPFGLLPASDPHSLRTAESILRANEALKGDPSVLARASYEPSRPSGDGSSSDRQDVSSLATLWMVRFLIQLGRETGQAKHWSRALAMLEGMVGRISNLGLAVRSPGRGIDSSRAMTSQGGSAWRLHAMLIDVLLDLAGLDYDAVAQRLTLRPTLLGQWPQTGIKQSFSCGEVWSTLERPIGSKLYRLNLKTQLRHPITLDVDLTCPDLKEMGPWQAKPATPEPTFNPRTGQIGWSVAIPAGLSEWNWSWG